MSGLLCSAIVALSVHGTISKVEVMQELPFDEALMVGRAMSDVDSSNLLIVIDNQLSSYAITVECRSERKS